MGNELAVRSAFDIELNSENLQKLADWVANFATAEQLAWNSDKFKELRDLLKIRKAAENLRIEAVRLECVALRKVGQANLESKLPAHDRKVAVWLAEMTESRFEALLEDCVNQVSPLSLMRECNNEERNLRKHIGGYGDFDPDADISDWGLEWEAKNILRSLEQFDSFTVEEAANALLDRLQAHRDDVEIPREFAETPLREVVRGVLRLPEPGRGVVRINDTVTFLPPFVTWNDGGTWRRIPWKRATVEHFRNMVETRELQAKQLLDKAQEMRELLAAVEMSSSSETESVDGAFVRAVQEGRIERVADYAKI